MLIECTQYQAGRRHKEATTVAHAARLSREGDGFVWVALGDARPEEVDELGAAFDLPALAVEDALEGHQRPRLVKYGECVLVVVKAVRYEEVTAQFDIGEVDVFVGPRYAVAVTGSAADILVSTRRHLDEHPEVAALGPMAALWALLDTVIDDGERVADLLGDQGEAIEQAVFEAHRDQSEPIYLLHRRVDRLARAVHPVLAILDTLGRGEPVASPEGLRPFLRDVCDHARRLSEEVAMLSERLDGLLNAHLARITIRQNVIVQQVSAWAAIAAVPTIITGIYGMNFRHFPELDWTFGYPLALLCMVVAVVVLRWHFRRIGWL